MIVQRMTFVAKPGRLGEMIELFRAERERTHTSGRISTFLYGSRDVLENELTFDNEQERQSFWDEWSSQPEAAKFLKKLQGLRESGGTNELLLLR